MQSIVIIGGGQASAFAASTLRKEGFTGKLSIISDEDNIFYERPPLSKEILKGEGKLDQLAFFNKDTIDALDIDWHKPAKATAINKETKSVNLDNGISLSYDKLIIATGSRPRVPNKEWLNFKNVYTLRTITDALKLKEKLLPNKRLAIIGGGWIGLEVAATGKQLGLSVNIFEREPRLCSRSVVPEVSEHLAKIHQQEGVHVHLNATNLTLEENPDGTITLHNDNDTIIADIIVVGAGAEIATELAIHAGLDVKGGIIVDEFGQTSDENIYAAGDVAIHPIVGFCTQSWAHAQQQASIVANSIMKDNAKPYTEIPWIWSDQYQHNIQIMGLPIDDECTLIIRKGGNGSKSFIHLDKENKIRSIIAFNEPKAIGIGRMWFRQGYELDPVKLADSSTDIMSFR